MASSGIRRKVDDLGRVVIPAGIRRTLGIREGDPVEVTVEGERVVLAKPRDACVFCGREEEQLTGFRGRLVCRDCLASLGSVDERLRTTAVADRPRPSDPPRSVDALPDWDAPAARPPSPPSPPPAAPAPSSGAGSDGEPADEAAADVGAADVGAADESGEDAAPPTPRDDEPPRTSRRPPYDPASTTAW